MRIACVNWSRRHAGGIESYVASILPALRASGHEVAFWSERDEPRDRMPLPLPAGVAAWCAATSGLEESMRALREWRPSVLFVHGLVDPAVERRLLEIAPAALMAHSYYGTCISGGKTTRLPSMAPCSRVLGPACLLHFYPRRCGGLHPVTLARDFRRQTERRDLLHRYERIVTLSAHMRREYLRHGLDAERVHHLPQYVPSLEPGAVGQTTRHPEGAVRLVFLGRLDRLKGCAVAIESLPQVERRLERPVTLTIAGDGPDRARCEQRAAEASSDRIRVEFRGWVAPQEAASLLTSADALVFPSLWPEPYGLSGIEALAAGVPVAAFASGAVPEWLREGIDGALAPADPPTAAGFAEALVRCVHLGRPAPWSEAVVADRRRQHALALAAVLERASGQQSGRVVA
jgi:glycosyltransferase involved in cell wall biosynthesis